MDAWSRFFLIVAVCAAVVTGVAALFTATLGRGDRSDWAVAGAMALITVFLIGRLRSGRSGDR